MLSKVSANISAAAGAPPRWALMVNTATVTKTNIGASNGVIHVIDTVLMPPMPSTSSK